MRPWIARAYGTDTDDSPIHALERGDISNEEFERLLAERLVNVDGLPVLADGLLTRMFAASVLDSAMQDLMRSLRHGVVVQLLGQERLSAAAVSRAVRRRGYLR